MKKKTNNINQELDNINPYEVDKLSKIPSWILIGLLKYWAAAAAVFFIAIGGTDIGLEWETVSEDPMTNIGITMRLAFFIALFMAILFNYVVKIAVRLMHNRRNNTYRYYLINQKGFMSFLYHIVYMMIMSFILCLLTMKLGQEGLIFNPFGTTDYGLEPFTYGFWFLVLDTICVVIKNYVAQLVQRMIYKKQVNSTKRVIFNADGTVQYKNVAVLDAPVSENTDVDESSSNQ